MYKKILVPLDGSALAECALEHAKTIAKGCSVPEMILLHVAPLSPYFTGGTGDVFPADMVEKEKASYQSWAKGYLENIEKALQKEGIAAKAVLLEGYVAESILGYAEKNAVDLIIMSTHGRTGAARWALGSVADRVVCHATVPVIVVAPPGCR